MEKNVSTRDQIKLHRWLSLLEMPEIKLGLHAKTTKGDHGRKKELADTRHQVFLQGWMSLQSMF